MNNQTAMQALKSKPLPAMQRVVCAAIKLSDGHIITGARHYDQIMVEQLQKANLFEPAAPQGFIDQYGNFLTREEAFVVAEMHNQFKGNGAPHTKGYLYSEDLY